MDTPLPTTIQCTLCLKTTIRNRSKASVNCSHLFCQGCTTKLLKTPSLSCPRCRKAIPLPKLQQNKYEEGEYMDPISLKDKSVNTTDKDSSVANICRIHQQPLDFYCLSCKIKVCSQCLLKEHKIREHDITSVEDFTKDEIQDSINNLNSFQKDQTELHSKLAEASLACAKDEEAVRQKIIKKRNKETNKIDTAYQSLDSKLTSHMKVTLKQVSLLKTRNEKVLDTIRVTRDLCDSVLADILKNKLDQESTLDKIREHFDFITKEINSLTSVFVPVDINLTFKEDKSSVALGKLSIRNDEANNCINVSGEPKWDVDSLIDVQNSAPDYASIVCLTKGWIVMVSSEYGTTKVIIEHFSDSKDGDVGQLKRRPCIVDTDEYNWTIGKRAGHDRSILLASGKHIYRISFRKKKEDLTQNVKVAFDIESISWDEFGIDIYVLSRNLRDVHWVSLNGTVTYLCSFQYNVQSVCNFVVSKAQQLALLDITNYKIHTFDCNSAKGDKIDISQPLPDGITRSSGKSDFTACSMASSNDHQHHFVLFYHADLIAVSHFDSSYRFIKWIIIEHFQFSENCLDICIEQDQLALLYNNKIAIYKIKSE